MARQPATLLVHVLPAALTCVGGARGGSRGREGETRCGTHSLSMGHSHSLGREGNSAAVLNPVNWRNSTTGATSVVLYPPTSGAVSLFLSLSPSLFLPMYLLPITFPFLLTRSLRGPSLSLPSPERCITQRSSIYGYGSIFAMVISPRPNRSKIHVSAFVSRIRNVKQ